MGTRDDDRGDWSWAHGATLGQWLVALGTVAALLVLFTALFSAMGW